MNTPSAQGASSTVLANDGSGNLVWNKLLYDGYELLFSTTTAQNMAAATTTSFATSSELLILIDSRGLASADSLALKFNNDTAANCGFTQTSAGQSGNESTTAGIEGCNIGSLATTSAQFISVRINNSSAFRKLGMSESVGNTSGVVAPRRSETTFVWNNTSLAITHFVLGTQQALTGGVPINITSGTRIQVYGRQ